MSVIVKGMEMPKNCYDCPFIRASVAGDYYCAKSRGYEDDLKKLYSQRMADCPLIELPPHGRLIDVDALKNDMRDWNPSIIAVVDATPTIIEAEGSEE